MTTTKSPYGEETISDDGFVRYSYQARDGGDNAKLLRASALNEPLVYFRGIRPKAFVPYFPVYVVADDTIAREFLIAIDETRGSSATLSI